MIVHGLLFVLALVLLWFPRLWLRLGAVFKSRRRSSPPSTVEPWNAREPGDPHVQFREFAKGRNYLDLGRAMVGGLALFGGMHIAPALDVSETASRGAGLAVLAIRALVLLVGVLIQTVRVERGRVTFYPPIFYLAGLTVGVCDVSSATFAFVLIWALTPMLGSATSFLILYSIIVGIFAHFFSPGGDLAAVLAAGLCFVPVLLSLLAKRPLAVFSRKSPRSTNQAR